MTSLQEAQGGLLRKGLENFPGCICHLASGGIKDSMSHRWEPRCTQFVVGCLELFSVWLRTEPAHPRTKGGTGWASVGTGGCEDTWFPFGELSILLELLHQVLATDFQFAKQNKFALIRKIHRKACLDCDAAARAIWIPSLQEALLTLMPSQACSPFPSNSYIRGAQMSSPVPG